MPKKATLYGYISDAIINGAYAYKVEQIVLKSVPQVRRVRRMYQYYDDGYVNVLESNIWIPDPTRKVTMKILSTTETVISTNQIPWNATFTQ